MANWYMEYIDKYTLGYTILALLLYLISKSPDINAPVLN